VSFLEVPDLPFEQGWVESEAVRLLPERLAPSQTLRDRAELVADALDLILQIFGYRIILLTLRVARFSHESGRPTTNRR